MMKPIKTRIPKEVGKVKYNFDISAVELLYKYILCDVTSDEDRIDVKKLIDSIDVESYRVNNLAIYMRLRTLGVIINSMVLNGISNRDLLYMELSNVFEPGLEVLKDVSLERNQINSQECKYIRKFISEKNQYVDVYKHRETVMKLLTSINESVDYNVSYYNTFNALKSAAGELITALNGKNNNNEGLLEEFSFSDSSYTENINNILTKANLPSAILQTGIRQLNALLAPGFRGGRLYTIIGGSGKFKSGTLLNLADQIRLYNPQVEPYENGRRRAILFVTLENSIEETIERIYDMYSDMNVDMRKASIDELKDTLKLEGGFEFNNDPNSPSGGIDIVFKYRKNLSITTNDIDAMITDLYNRDYEVIAVICDYIKRMDSIYPSNGDERVRMSNVGKELKSLAQSRQIPVITAMQLNRSGNSALDDATRDGKQDVARFAGTSQIGNAWDIVEDSDWVALINLEMQKSTNRLFLTFKRLKIRGKKIVGAVDYFNHPFINMKNIRLEADVHLDAPLSVVSLATDLTSVPEDSHLIKRVEEQYIGNSLKKRSEANNIKMQLSNI